MEPDGVGQQPVPVVLRPYVASLVGYDVSMCGPGVHRGLPSTSLTLVLPLDDPLRVGWAGEQRAPRSDWSSLSGLHTAPAAIHHDGHQTGVQLGLTLAGARALLGLPAAELAGELTDLTAAVPALARLPDRLHAEPTWVGRYALVWRSLVDALARNDIPEPRAEVGHALAALTRGMGVAAVADEVGYSRRHLGNLVRAEAGLSPKHYQRIARFETSRSLLVDAARAGRPSLADVAAAAGYADQAHLTREWQDLAGCTPSVWLAEEFPFVQASGGLDEGV